MDLSIDRHSSCSIPPTSQPSSFFPPTYKIVIVGNMGVGKTSLLWRYLFNEYRTIECRATIVDIERKKVSVSGNKEVELEFWDTAGQLAICTMTQLHTSLLNFNRSREIPNHFSLLLQWCSCYNSCVQYC